MGFFFPSQTGFGLFLDNSLTWFERARLFPQTCDSLDQLEKEASEWLLLQQQILFEAPATYEAFIEPYELVVGLMGCVDSLLWTMSALSPDSDVRTRALLLRSAIAVRVRILFSQPRFYQKYVAFAENYEEKASAGTHDHDLSYVLEKRLFQLRREGCHLDSDNQRFCLELLEEIDALENQFQSAIVSEVATIPVPRAALADIDPGVYAQYQSDAETVFARPDYPLYYAMMAQCPDRSARRDIYVAFASRGLPTNDTVLPRFIERRNEYARFLGYANYAELSLSQECAKTPERAEIFIATCIEKTAGVTAELMRRLTDLSRELYGDSGEVYPWDIAYLSAVITKGYTSFSEESAAVGDYFPSETTFERLLSVAGHFFSLEFRNVPLEKGALWSDDIFVQEVLDKSSDRVLGHILFDLYPRPGKFSHACAMKIMGAISSKRWGDSLALSVIIANCARPDSETGMPFRDMRTFIHELGHALHEILGRTPLLSCSGTSVTRDFIELPSQLSEDWLADQDSLERIARPALTKEGVGAEICTALEVARAVDIAFFIRRQTVLACFGLEVYQAERGMVTSDSLARRWRELYAELYPGVIFSDEEQGYASYFHLSWYDARYYSYLWSRVTASHCVEQIQRDGGLGSSKAGARYREAILAHGGFVDPEKLIAQYLSPDIVVSESPLFLFCEQAELLLRQEERYGL